MARRAKKQQATPAGAPAWMVTYSDMVTLLLTFFVMLLAMANFEDMTRVSAVMNSIRLALWQGEIESSGQESSENTVPADEQVDTHPLIVQLRESLADHLSNDRIKMTETVTEIRIKIDERLLFGVGETSIHPTAYGLLKDIAIILSNEPVTIIAEGYTDAQGEPGQNWELSALRAVAVVKALQDLGSIEGEKLQASGFGSYHPSDTDPNNSSWNRRVELVIHSDQYSGIGTLDKISNIEGGSDGR